MKKKWIPLIYFILSQKRDYSQQAGTGRNRQRTGSLEADNFACAKSFRWRCIMLNTNPLGEIPTDRVDPFARNDRLYKMI